jgi:hypothetical protein
MVTQFLIASACTRRTEACGTHQYKYQHSLVKASLSSIRHQLNAFVKKSMQVTADEECASHIAKTA